MTGHKFKCIINCKENILNQTGVNTCEKSEQSAILKE